MFAISAQFRASRGSEDSGKPGVAFLRIREKRDLCCAGISSGLEDAKDESSNRNRVVVVERCVNTDVRGYDVGVLHRERERIVRLVRLACCVVEGLAESGRAFGVEEVARNLRRALRGEAGMERVLARAREDFPLRADLVSVGREFRGDFRFVYRGEKDEKPVDLLDFIGRLSRRMREAGKVSQARSYSSTGQSLLRFVGGGSVGLGAVNREFVEGYGDWLLRQGVSESTQSFYLRTLRSILNHAREEGVACVDEDMFAGLNTRVSFKAVRVGSGVPGRDVLRRIADVNLSGDVYMDLARDMFMFGFYCRGMELSEMMGLRRCCIQDGVLCYRRRGRGRERSVHLGEEALRLVRKYESAGGEYVFPLKPMFRGREENTISDRVGKCLKRIGEAVGFPSLCFSMNIRAWRGLAERADVSGMLLGQR